MYLKYNDWRPTSIECNHISFLIIEHNLLSIHDPLFMFPMSDIHACNGYAMLS